MASRMKRITDSAKKRRKAAQSRKSRYQMVNLRDQIDKWKEIMEENGCGNDGEVAKLLIDCYRNSAKEPIRKKRKTSTPAAGHLFASEISASSISPARSVSVSLTSGLEELGGSSQSENGSRKKTTKRQTAPSTSQHPDVYLKKFPQISFEEISDLDADEDNDDEDESYVPSLWEMSISLNEPVRGEVQREDDISVMVHDIENPGEEEPVPEAIGRTLNEVTDAQLEDEMHIVTQMCILELASMIRFPNCTKCNGALNIDRKKKGTAVVLIWSCENNHIYHTWHSQPVLRNGVMLGNIKFLSAITLSGNNYQKIALMCKFLNLAIPSVSNFTRVQSHLVVPTVQEFWTKVKETAQEEIRATDIVIAGDGRMDSPGHSAKYCTYTVMDQNSKKILAMEVVDKRECMLVSGRMEALGFERALNELRRSGLNIVEVVTDAHPQIAAIMRRNFPNTQHSWDIWHGAKNLGKKLCAASQEKGKKNLKPWINSITNHFYYSAEHCEMDDFKLSVKFTSIINHCTNRHIWALGQCEHGDIEEDPNKQWLDPCGPETEALEKIITDYRFQSTLKHYITCQTTSELESFNNHLLMYAAKRQAFTYAVYKCRCQLAAIDYMEHLNRPYKKNSKGEYCYDRVYSKAANHWSVKPKKEQKKYTYINTLLATIFERYCSGESKISYKVKEVEGDPARIAKTIAPITPPPTKELVEKQEPRLKKQPKPGSSKDPY